MKCEPRQFVQDHPEFQLTTHDLRNELDPMDTVQRRAQANAHTQFDLQQFPLYRAELLQTAAQDGRSEPQYVFLFTLHHIIADAWSMGVLVQELSTIYEAYCQELPNPLPPLKQQYRHFATWQNKLLASSQGDAERAFWLNQFDGVLPTLELPTDETRPPLLTFAGDIVSTTFTTAETAVLQQIARQQGATPFMALVAWVKLLLYRYTGQEEIIVGTPIAGREDATWQNQVGFFVNTLALRDTVDPDAGFVDLLGAVRETAVAAYAHQQYPFDQLVIDLDLERDLSRNPLFDVIVHLQYLEDNELHLGDVRVADVETNFTAAKFDLTFEFVQTADVLHLHLNYNANLYARDRMERLLGHLHTLLLTLSSQPNAPIGKLALLTGAEREQLLVQWNDTKRPYPRESSIGQAFAAQVSKTPTATAVSFGEQSLTYEQLHQQANQMAHYLRRLGVVEGDMVGIAMNRSLEMVIGLLGILQVGGVFVPLEPDYPVERLKFMLTDTAVSVLLTQAHLLAKLPSFDGHVIAVDQEWEVIAQQPDDELQTAVHGEMLAYVMYTSGSTGQPKGVAVPHRAVLRLVSAPNYAQLSEQETFLLLAPISFDASTLEIWGALLNGAKLVIAPPQQLSLAELGAVIRENNVSILWLTAGLFTLMVEQQLQDLAGVRQLLAGGDVLPLPQVQKVLRDLPQCQLINGYGPTENTTFTCCYPINNSAQLNQSVPIGRPVTNTQIYILDASMQPVPIGVWGNLYAAGDGLAHGYWQRPELTAVSFISHPFSEEPTARLYKTGDVARYLPDGNVQFLGRRDNQVKIRGFRIELGEIELVLRQFDGVQECVVVPQADESGVEKWLVAYLVAEETAVSSDQLRAFLPEKLPNFMIPAHFVFLTHLPLSPNGKVDRGALSRQTVAYDYVSDGYVPATTEMEQQLAAIWQAVLDLDRIGIHDDFFDLGGHSLLATRVVAQIQSEMGVEIRLSDLFVQPTIAELAEAITQLSLENDERVVTTPILPAPPADHYPVSHAQRRLWVIEKMGVARAAYNIPAAIWLNDQIDLSALPAALQTVVERHEAMRTTFIEVDGEARQIVHENLAWKMGVVEIDVAVAELLPQRIQQEIAQPFDLTAPLLFRFTLFLLPERPLLLLTIHHIISDGWSLELLLEEVLALIQGKTLTPLPIQYKDYAVWQTDYLQSTSVQPHRQYWLEDIGWGTACFRFPH